MVRFRLIAGLYLALSTLAVGQVRFEAASVKRSDPSQAGPAGAIAGKIIGGPGTADPGQVTGFRITLLSLIRTAFDLAPDQLSAPAWLQTEKYDLVAKVGPGAGKDDVKQMLQALLAERFRLRFHRDAQQFDGYALVLAPGGSKLKPTAYADARPIRPGAGPGAGGADADGYPNLPAGYSGAASAQKDGAAYWRFQAEPVSALIANLQAELGSLTTLNTWSPGRVLDETGLTGRYDFKLMYSSSGQIGSALSPDAAADPGGGPTLFVALEKQLGLRLLRRKVSVEVMKVDSIEQVPTEN